MRAELLTSAEAASGAGGHRRARRYLRDLVVSPVLAASAEPGQHGRNRREAIAPEYSTASGGEVQVSAAAIWRSRDAGGRAVGLVGVRRFPIIQAAGRRVVGFENAPTERVDLARGAGMVKTGAGNGVTEAIGLTAVPIATDPGNEMAADQADRMPGAVEVPMFSIRADQPGAVPALMVALPKLGIVGREAEEILRTFELFLDTRSS